jgi:phytoene/squalene synthetase
VDRKTARRYVAAGQGTGLVRDGGEAQLTGGVVVPYRTLHRFAVERCGFGRRRSTVRVADG